MEIFGGKKIVPTIKIVETILIPCKNIISIYGFN